MEDGNKEKAKPITKTFYFKIGTFERVNTNTKHKQQIITIHSFGQIFKIHTCTHTPT